MHYSKMLRGSTMPTDFRLYLPIITLIFLLILKILGIWEKVDFTKNKDDNATAEGEGVAMILAGILALTVHIWAGPNHTMNGYNLVLVLKVPLLISGITPITSGSALLARLTSQEKS